MVDLQIGRSRLPEHLARERKSQELAERLGVSEAFISRVIGGKAQLSVVKMKLAADFLNCRMDELCEWEYGKRK